MLFGDMVHAALAAVGVTEERVRRVFGKCNCQARRQKLNRLHAWARQVASDMIRLKFDRAEALRHFNAMFGEE